jgi:hypothetical protein
LANNLLTISQITNEGLMVLENDLCFADHVNRQYADQFALSGAKIGYTVNVRKPPRYIGVTGPALSVEDTNETYIPVTLTTQFHVDVQFTTADLATSIDLFKERIINPAVATVANKIDRDGAVFAYQNIANAVGTPGTPPASFLSFTLAGAVLDGEAAPRDGYRVVILDPFSMAYAQDGVKGLFNPQAQISEQIRKGMIAKNFAGFDWYMDQNVVSYTTGAASSQTTAPTLSNNTSSAWLASGWSQSGYMETTNWTASTGVLTVGDIITVTGVFSANPQNRGAYGGARQRQFTVIPPVGTQTSGTYNSATGVYTSGSGAGALSVYVANTGIYAGQFQNITAQPSSSATLQVWGSTGNTFPNKSVVTPQNIAMHRDCLALAFADLDLPGGVDMAARAVDEEAGINFRVVRQYTINNDALPCRFDVLYGWAKLYPELGVRISG